MIGSLYGSVSDINGNTVLLNVGNIGYLVHFPPKAINAFTDKQIQVYTHLHVREDALELYGFLTREELQLFTMLISVSGIGPKTALLVIDHGVRQVHQAITVSDVDFFTGIPRLGKKNAQKIIIELKPKIGSTKDLDLTGNESSETSELIDVLGSMGFVRTEILSVIKKLDIKDITIEDKIRHCLRLLEKPSKRP